MGRESDLWKRRVETRSEGGSGVEGVCRLISHVRNGADVAEERVWRFLLQCIPDGGDGMTFGDGGGKSERRISKWLPANMAL